MNKKAYIKPEMKFVKMAGDLIMAETSWTVNKNGGAVVEDDVIDIIEGDPEGGLSGKERGLWDAPIENSLW